MLRQDDRCGPGRCGCHDDEFEDLTHRIDAIREQMAPLLPMLAAARNAYYTDPTSQNESQLDAIQSEVSALHEESSRLVAEISRASGLPPEMFEAVEENDATDSRPDHLPRHNLTVDQVESTADIDALLPDALDRIESLLPNGWLDEEPREASRIDSLLQPDSFLSLTKGIHIDGERSALHR